MVDGRHTGTGGGNTSCSAARRRPTRRCCAARLLRSLLTYWQNHPSLSYLPPGCSRPDRAGAAHRRGAQ